MNKTHRARRMIVWSYYTPSIEECAIGSYEAGPVEVALCGVPFQTQLVVVPSP
jgi:hypothetical protein